MLWYAADISYSRSEGVHLHLWASGEQHCSKHKHHIPPTLSIQLCPVDSLQNADHLVLQPLSHHAMIEEVSDEDVENYGRAHSPNLSQKGVLLFRFLDVRFLVLLDL